MAQSENWKMSDYLSENQIKEYVAVFQLFKQEKQQKSHLTRQELATAMRMLGLNPKEEDLQNIINTIDVEEGGHVQFENFVQMMEHQRIPDEEEALRQAFNVFDADQRRYIESEELRHVMESIKIAKKADLNEILHDLGIDRDRKITYEEFKTFISANIDQQDTEDRAAFHLTTSV